MAQLRPSGAINGPIINADAVNGPGELSPTYYATFAETPDLIIPAEPNTVVFPREVRELVIPDWP